jgi:hypothetical protein
MYRQTSFGEKLLFLMLGTEEQDNFYEGLLETRNKLYTGKFRCLICSAVLGGYSRH